MNGPAQRSRVTAARASEVAKNAARQTAASSLNAMLKLNEKDSLAALKTATSALSTALNSDPR